MDAFARALLIADKMLSDGKLQGFVDERYAGWKDGLGKEILGGRLTLEQISERVLKGQSIDPKPRSGRQEMLENLVNKYL